MIVAVLCTDFRCIASTLDAKTFGSDVLTITGIFKSFPGLIRGYRGGNQLLAVLINHCHQADISIVRLSNPVCSIDTISGRKGDFSNYYIKDLQTTQDFHSARTPECVVITS